MPPQSPSASGLMQAAQRGAPWANEVVNTGSLRRQIVSQVQNAEANAEIGGLDTDNLDLWHVQVNKAPKMRIHCMENLKMAFDFMRKEKVKLK